MNKMILNNLIAGDIKLVSYEGDIPSSLYRFTSRFRSVKNEKYYQVEVFSTDAPVKACFYVKGEDKEECIKNLLTLWGAGAFISLLSPETKGKSPSTCPTFSDYSKDIFTFDGRYAKRLTLQEKSVSVKDLKSYQSVINDFCAKYGKRHLDEFDDVNFLEKMVTEYKQKGRRGKRREFSDLKKNELSTARVKNILLVVSRVFDFAIDDRLITVNPIPTAIQMLPPKSNEKSFSIIPVELERRMFTEPSLWGNDYILYAMLLLLDLTGMRLGEAIALQHTDIDFERNAISVTKQYRDNSIVATKTRTERLVPMCSLLKQALEPLVIRKGYLFSKDGSKPFTRIKYARHFEAILGRMGVLKKEKQEEKIVLHSFRHSFISHLVAKNVSDTNISLITGHDTQKISSMNMRYTQQLMESFPHIIEAMESIYDDVTKQKIAETTDYLMPEYWKTLVKRSALQK